MTNKIFNIYIVGDSHVEKWIQANRTGESKKYFHIVGMNAFPGKTAQGMSKESNKNLMTQALAKHVDQIDFLIIELGEVDCGYTIWSRMKIHNTTAQEEIEFATSRLMDLAREARKLGIKQTIVLGPIVPLVEEYGDDTPKMLWKRKEVEATYAERTQLVLEFNKSLKKKAKLNRLLYVDINDILLDPETELAKTKYQNKINHHLGINIAIKLWLPRIHKLLEDHEE